jgi:hypothetical protein
MWDSTCPWCYSHTPEEEDIMNEIDLCCDRWAAWTFTWPFQREGEPHMSYMARIHQREAHVARAAKKARGRK